MIAAHPPVTAGQAAAQLADGRWLLSGGDQTQAALRLVDATGRGSILPAHLNQPRTEHSATLLPDGTVLIFGGMSPSGAVLDTAEVFDPANASLSLLGSVGLLPRAAHTATVLKDGRLLLAGGFGADRQPILDAELYNPTTRQTERFNARLDSARLHQIAALLPDQAGSVLWWGGSNERGKLRGDGDVYDPTSGKISTVSADRAKKLTQSYFTADAPSVVESSPAAHAANVPVGSMLRLRFSKRMAVASLNTDTVILIGPNGTTALKAVGVENGVTLFVTPKQELIPGSHYTLFVQGATDENGEALPFTAIGFTTAVLDSSASDGTSSSGSGSTVSSGSGISLSPSRTGHPVGGSSGPSASNFLSNLYLVIDQLTGSTTGRQQQTSASPIDDSEIWVPDARNYHGDWTSRWSRLSQQTLPKQTATSQAIYGDPAVAQLIANLRPADVAKVMPKLRAAAAKRARAESGQTAVSGQVLKLNGRPLAGVVLSIGTRATRSDANGEFLLPRVPSGRQILVIDGSQAGLDGRQYGRYEYGVDIVANKVNALPFVIWMTRLDPTGTASLSSPTQAPTVLTNPKIPGLELHIPAGTVIRDDAGKIVTQLNMTAIPTDQPPFPIPAVPVPTYFTIQPGGAHLEGANGQVSQGAQLIYPNFTKSPPGTRISFWNYDAVSKGWYVYGQGTVSADGQQVVPDPGVAIYEFSGAMVSLPSNAPADGPCDDCQPEPGLGDAPDNPAGYVDPSTGLLDNSEVDMTVPDTIPIQVARSYRQQDMTSRGFGIGTNLSYDFFNVGDSHGTTSDYDYQDLILPNGGQVHFPRISAGTSFGDAVYQNSDAPGEFYGALLKWDQGGLSAWKMTMRDGTSYEFEDSDSSPVARHAAVRGITDRNGNALTLTRDGNDNLTQITSPNGRHLNFVYDGSNRVIQASDDMGRAVKYGYDGQGRLVSVTDPAGGVKQYTYDANSNMTSIIDARGNTVVTNTYDGNNRVVAQTFPDGSTKTYQYTLDSTGTTVAQTFGTDRCGNQSQWSFSGSGGYVTGQTFGAGSSAAQSFAISRAAGTNLVNSRTDALGRTTTYVYDSLGNVTKVVRPDGSTVSIAYDTTFSNPTQITDANGHSWKMSYDSYGDLLTVTDPLNHVTTYAYDGYGRLVKRTDPLGHSTSLGYTGPDVTSVTDGLGRTAAIARDAVGRITSMVDPIGNRNLRSYDVLGRLVSSTDPSGHTTTFGYDANSNLTSVTDPAGHSIQYSYDALNRRTSRTDELTSIESWTYNSCNTLARHTDRNGQATGYSYDALERLTQVSYADGATVARSYDAADRLTQVSDSVSGVITRNFDLLDRITQEQTPQGTVHYGYDAGGRRTSMSIGNGPSTVYTYDAANRLTSISTASETVSLSYDDADRRSQLTLPNGVVTQYSFDAANELTGLAYVSGQTTLGSLNYGYDAGGQRVGTSGTWASDHIPAATSSDYQYNAANRITGGNSTAPTFDANGNMLSDGQGKSYVWDARQRLISISQGTSTLASFAYDSFGRRISKTVGNSSVAYLYDGDDVIQEQGATTTSLLTGLGMDERYARDDVNGRTYFLTDGTRSTVALTDANANVVQQYQYEPFGEVTQVNPGSTLTNPYQYTGRENDLTGLIYYRARYYNPTLKRFISEDPMGYGGGSNFYAYVNNNPLSLVDPLGLSPRTCGEILSDIYNKADLLQNEFQKYDPDADAAGGPNWKSYGHYKEMRDLQRGLKNDITEYKDRCGGGGGNGPPVPRWIDDMANRPIPTTGDPPESYKFSPSDLAKAPWWVLLLIPVIIVLAPAGA